MDSNFNNLNFNGHVDNLQKSNNNNSLENESIGNNHSSVANINATNNEKNNNNLNNSGAFGGNLNQDALSTGMEFNFLFKIEILSHRKQAWAFRKTILFLLPCSSTKTTPCTIISTERHNYRLLKTCSTPTTCSVIRLCKI